MQGKEKDYFTALYDVARVINASLETGEVLNQIVKCVAETMGVKACSLRLLDSQGERLLWGGAHGLSEGYIRKGTVLVKESGLDRKALNGSSSYVRDARTDPDFQYGDKAEAEGIRSVLVVPLRVELKPIGVIRVYTDDVREFDDQEIRFMESVANLSAIAIDNARLHQSLRTDFDLLMAHKDRLDDN